MPSQKGVHILAEAPGLGDDKRNLCPVLQSAPVLVQLVWEDHGEIPGAEAGLPSPDFSLDRAGEHRQQLQIRVKMRRE